MEARSEAERGRSILALLDRRAETDIPDVLRSRFYDRAESVQGEGAEEAKEGARRAVLGGGVCLARAGKEALEFGTSVCLSVRLAAL